MALTENPQQPTGKLEQSFRNICEKHGLVSLDVSLMRPDVDYDWFHVSIQWIEYGSREIATGNGDNIAQALGNALADMLAKRGLAEPVVLADEPLTIGETV